MGQKRVSANDYNEVVNVVTHYIEALRIGNIERLAGIFHEDAVTYGTVNGELMGGGSGNPTVDFIKTYGKSPDIEAHVDVLDMTPSTAVVRMIMEKDAIGSECHEALLLIKRAGSWTVIAKVFHQFDQ